MARDEDGEAILRAERAGGAGGTGTARERGELAVGHDLAARNGAKGKRELLAERRELAQVEIDVCEVVVRSGEVPAEPRDQSWREIVTAVGAFSGYASPQWAAGWLPSQGGGVGGSGRGSSCHTTRRSSVQSSATPQPSAS